MNRPKALNSLNYNMVHSLLNLYKEWAATDDIHCVLLRANGGKAFCAGGDVKGAVQDVVAGRAEDAFRFFQEEYRLNHYLGARLPKPHVALMDGITMGGGAGVSVHGAIRVATEKTVFAMPECGIGLVPDVGASHFLPRLPGHLGTYLGLTGARLKGIEVLDAQLATHYVASDRLPGLEERIRGLGAAAGDVAQLAALVDAYQEDEAAPAPSALLDRLPDINACFGCDSVEAIHAALELRGDTWADATLAMLRKGSPLSQKLTLRELRLGRGQPLSKNLTMEYRLVRRCCEGPSDFVEGVSALLIDKGRAPCWRHAGPSEVSDEEVEAFFAPLPPGQELDLDPPPSRL